MALKQQQVVQKKAQKVAAHCIFLSYDLRTGISNAVICLPDIS